MKTLFERMSDIARSGGSVAQKADYVRREAAKGSDGRHTCHWPGCDRRVPPSMWGCKPHWFALPNSIRTKLWGAYEPGQEIAKNPTPKYLDAMHEAQEWAEAENRRRDMVNRGWEYDL